MSSTSRRGPKRSALRGRHDENYTQTIHARGPTTQLGRAFDHVTVADILSLAGRLVHEGPLLSVEAGLSEGATPRPVLRGQEVNDPDHRVQLRRNNPTITDAWP